MGMLYADRAFLTINGARLVDVQTAAVRRNFNASAVKSMTPDGFNRGYVQGNQDVDADFTIAVENDLARPKLENIDYHNNDVALNFVVGADQYVVGPLFPKSVEDSAPGVGEAVKTSFSLGALRITDGVGNSVLGSGIDGISLGGG
jgi:hypothetical protein